MIDLKNIYTPEYLEKINVQEINKKDFPISVFPPQYQFFLNELKSTSNFSIDITGTALMSLFATICGNRFKLYIKNTWISKPIFWFCILGSPGSTKSHPLKFILKPLMDKNLALKKEFDIEMVRYEELDEKAKRQNPRPIFPQMVISDTTVEGVCKTHKFTPNGLLIYRDELVGWINSMNAYKGGKGSDEAFWLTSFDGGDISVTRATQDPVILENSMVNIIGSIQPDVLFKIKLSSSDNGFLDRLLYAKDEGICHYLPRQDFNQDYINAYHSTINDFIEKVYFNKNLDEVLHFDKDAEDYFYKLDIKITDIQNNENTSNNLKNCLSKFKTYIPRFILILYLIDMSVNEKQDDFISIKYVQDAEKLFDYFYNNVLLVFKEQNEIKEIKTIQKSEVDKKKGIIKSLKEGIKGTIIAQQFDVKPSYVSKIKKENNL